MSHRLALAAAAGAALLLTAAAAPAQTAAPATGEAGTAASPAQPPDVSRIVIRRPNSAVVRPEDYRNPVPITEDESLEQEEDEALAEDDAVEVDPEIAQDIVVRDAPEAGAAGPPAVPNTTSADVNHPGVRVRVGQ